MSQKSKKAIAAELESLKKLKPIIIPRSMFGDDNSAALDAAIETLEQGLSESEIDQKQDDEEWLDNEVSSARGAQQWRDGESKERPSEGWPLKK